MENLKTNEYTPSEDVQRRSKKTPENRKYLQDRLSQVMRLKYPKSSRRKFISDVIAFVESAPNNCDIDPKHELTVDGDRLGKFMRDNEPNKQITPEDFKCICIFLDYKGLFYNRHRGDEIAEKFEDPLFHSLLDFMKIGEFTLNNMKRHAPGFYRCYRPASTFPGNFWVGAMEISDSPDTGALVTREFYQSAGFEGRPNKKVELNGYLFRKGRHYTIISRDQASSSLSVALLPSVITEDHKITNLTGAVLDMSTGHLWGGRVIYDRVDLPASCVHTEIEGSVDAKLDEENFFASAKVCYPEEIPNSIEHHFKNEPIPNLQMF